MAQSDVPSISPRQRDSLTVTQAAQLLGVSAWTLRKWTAQSLLASERTVGGHRRYRRTELERFRTELLAHGDASGVHEHLHRLAVLSEVAGAVFAQLEPAETLRIVCEKLLAAMQCTVAIVSAYDAESASVRTLADYDIRGHLWGDQQAYALHDLPMIAHVVAQQVPVVVNRSDVNADPGELASMASYGAQSLLILPLAFGGVTIGVAKLLDSSGERHYSRAELTLALAIADQAALALHNVDLYETARRRNRELEALLRIAEAVTAAGGVESVMRVVAQALLQALGAYWCAIFDYDAPTGLLRSLVHECVADHDASEWRTTFALDEILSQGQAVREKKPVVTYIDDPDLAEASKVDMKACGDMSQLFVPMIWGAEVVGLIYVGEVRQLRRFSKEDMRLATTIAAQGANAVETARSYARERQEREEIARSNHTLHALAELSATVRGLTDESQVLTLVGRVLTEALEFRQALAYLYEPERDIFRVRPLQVLTEAEHKHYEGLLMPGKVLRGLLADATPISHSHFLDHRLHQWTGEERVWQPMVDLGERAAHEWHTLDGLLVPMIGEQSQLIGYLEAYDPIDRQRPTPTLVRQIELFAGKAASDLELRRLYDRLELQARTDALTGLLNRRSLLERLAEELAKARRFGTPLSLIMIDVDDFKAFNDRFGHPEGDELLRVLADVLRRATRQHVDLVARYGGEEFVVVLPSTPAGGAEALAGRVRGNLGSEERSGMAIADMIRQTMAEHSSTARSEKAGLRVTLSVGVASYPDHGSSAAELIANSDTAMYAAKRLGKNRTCVYRSENGLL